MSARTPLTACILAAAALLLPATGHAAADLVVNGNFEQLTNGDNQIVPGQTSGTFITSANSWYSTSTSANAGYPFLFFATNAVTTGFGDAWDNGQRYLWGAANGGANTWNGTSASGGHYLVMDADYHATAINQNISGLVVGTDYAVTFSWAAAQFFGFTGATTELLKVSLGDQTKSTQTYSLPSTGFSGWMTTTLNFRYSGGSNVLSFLASGAPAGLPPMVLLDGVSMAAVPEPASMLAFAAGLVLLGATGIRRMRRRGVA